MSFTFSRAMATSLCVLSSLLPRARICPSLRTRAMTHGRVSVSVSAAGPSYDASSYRVLSFEDSYDIAEMLKTAEVRMGHHEQRWSSENAVEVMRGFGRIDVLLLDFYLPPVTGLAVLQQVNEAVLAGLLERPKFVLGMSSVSSCNNRLIAAGADKGFVKWDIGDWEGWAREGR